MALPVARLMTEFIVSVSFAFGRRQSARNAGFLTEHGIKKSKKGIYLHKDTSPALNVHKKRSYSSTRSVNEGPCPSLQGETSEKVAPDGFVQRYTPLRISGAGDSQEAIKV